MAEVLLPLFASPAGTAAAASAATTIGPVTAAASGAATLSSFGSLIGTGLTAASAFGSIMGGGQEAAMYKAQAKQSELSAKQEELKGRLQADKIRNSLLATLASQRAAFSARGISLGSGTPVNLASQSYNEASKDIELAQFGAGMASAAELAQADQYKMAGKSSKIKGYTNAGFSLYAGKNSFGSLL